MIYFEVSYANLLLVIYLDDHHIVRTQVERFLDHCLKFNSSYKNMESMAKLVNSTPNAAIKLPHTKYKIQKFIAPNISRNFHIKCNTCNTYIASTTTNGVCTCKKMLKSSSSDYFITFPLVKQIEQSIKTNINQILDYHASVLVNNDICDLHNAKIYQNAKSCFPNSIILPLIINTDGVKVYNSSKSSLWMIQVCQVYLHPKVRYVQSNILIIGAHFGTRKPPMKEFFYPVLKELYDVKNEGGIYIMHNGKQLNFVPLLLCCTCDIPAKANVLGMVGHMGRFACSYCLHPGSSIKCVGDKKSVIRYTKSVKSNEMRTHEHFIDTYGRLNTDSIMGIQNVSCMVAASHFDLVQSFAIDAMHCVHLGVMKKLLSLWLDTKYHQKPFHIKKQKQIGLSNRIISLKPVSEMSRKPKSIFSRSDFKANEYRSLLFYYLRFTLHGALDIKYIRNFEMLSSSIYILSKEKVSLNEIEEANTKLNEFADTFEDLYGKNQVTINLHLIRHLADAVKNLGPLWVHSAYVFEANNGVVIAANNSKRDIVHQLAWKYSMKKTLAKSHEENKTSVSGKRLIRINASEYALFAKHKLKISENGYLTVYRSAVFRNTKFTCELSKEISTIDYFVQISDKIYGAVRFYTAIDFNLYAMINIYNVIETIHHFKKIQRTDIIQVIKMNEIKEKLLYLKIGRDEYITSFPNKYEKM